MIESIACNKSSGALIGLCGFVRNKKQFWPEWHTDEKNLVEYVPSDRLEPGNDVYGVPVIINGDHVDKVPIERVFLAMYWTFVPSSVELCNWDDQTSYITFVTSLNTTPMYREALADGRRCAIVMEGFYLKKETSGAVPEYYFVELEDGQGKMMMAAGLFDTQTLDDKNVYSCCLISTAAVGSIREVSSRIPLLLTSDLDIDRWINHMSVGSDKALRDVRDAPEVKLHFYKTKGFGFREPASEN